MVRHRTCATTEPTAWGNVVLCNRLLAEADLSIVVGHCAGNPYGGYSGGYKMIVTGFTGWRSIASHHCPQTMHRLDWLGASTESRMRHQFRSIGEAMEKGMGKKIFSVDAVLGQFGQVLAVAAGELAAVEEATWPLAGQAYQRGAGHVRACRPFGDRSCPETSITDRAWAPTLS